MMDYQVLGRSFYNHFNTCCPKGFSFFYFYGRSAAANKIPGDNAEAHANTSTVVTNKYWSENNLQTPVNTPTRLTLLASLDTFSLFGSSFPYFRSITKFQTNDRKLERVRLYMLTVCDEIGTIILLCRH